MNETDKLVLDIMTHKKLLLILIKVVEIEKGRFRLQPFFYLLYC